MIALRKGASLCPSSGRGVSRGVGSIGWRIAGGSGRGGGDIGVGGGSSGADGAAAGGGEIAAVTVDGLSAGLKNRKYATMPPSSTTISAASPHDFLFIYVLPHWRFLERIDHNRSFV